MEKLIKKLKNICQRQIFVHMSESLTMCAKDFCVWKILYSVFVLMRHFLVSIFNECCMFTSIIFEKSLPNIIFLKNINRLLKNFFNRRLIFLTRILVNESDFLKKFLTL